MTTPTEQNVKATNVKDVLAYLAERFPACFNLAGDARPLKVGIFQDLAERLQDDAVVSKTQLRQALRVYTSSWRYLAATKEGIARVDLDGTAGDLIDASQAEHASKTLEDSKAKAAEKRKARIAEARAKQPKPAADKPAYKKNQNKKPVQASKNAKVNQKPAAAADNTPAVSLQPVAASAVVAGAKVLIKLGQSPMPATVLEVSKDDVTVQLGSGMVIKTRQDSLYLA